MGGDLKLAAVLRRTRCWLWLAVAALANSAMARDLGEWLRAEPLSELPVAERRMLLEAMDQANHDDALAVVNSAASCARMLRAESDVRPSVVASVCNYVGFELAAIWDHWLDSPGRLTDSRDQLLELGVVQNVGRWREFVAIRSGWLARLAGHPISTASLPPHPALRPWQVIRALEHGDMARARAQQIFLGAPKCPRSCAYAALISLARGMLAAREDKRDQAIAFATRAAEQLSSAAESEPHLVALLAPEVAVLLDQLGRHEDRDQIVRLGLDAAQRSLPQAHAAHRHLGATRHAFLAADGKSEAAAALRDELTARHGVHLTRYPLTAARLRLAQSGRSQ